YTFAASVSTSASPVSLSPAGPLRHGRVGPAAAAGDEAVDLRLEHRQGHGSELEHRIVKRAHVEAVAEGFLGARARLEQGPLAEVVGKRLARPGDISVHLGGDLVLGERGVLLEVIHRLLARPALCMDAGVDHQPRGAPDLVAEHAEALVSALLHPHLETELLAVERPALAVGRDIG